MTNCFTTLFEIKKLSQASFFSCLKNFLGLSNFFLIQRIYILCPKDKSHYLKLIIMTLPVNKDTRN